MSADRPLRVGTRASALALWQTERVRARLAAIGRPTERIEISTTGDVIQHVSLSRIGSVALFTRQLDDAMLAGRIDLAVHSLKDLPTTLPDGIVLAAVSDREDPRDALVGRGPLRWADVPAGAVIATSSLRRRAQLLHARPDLTVVDIRGNVDTRLAKLDAHPAWAATMLAAAGLRRLGFAARIGECLDPALMLPAPGQGALAVTVRAGDDDAAEAARAAIHDDPTARCVAAERSLLRRLEGGCSVPIGAHAVVEGGALRLAARVVALDGTAAVDGSRAAAVAGAPEADALGEALAEELLSRGADVILAALRARPPAHDEP